MPVRLVAQTAGGECGPDRGERPLGAMVGFVNGAAPRSRASGAAPPDGARHSWRPCEPGGAIWPARSEHTCLCEPPMMLGGPQQEVHRSIANGTGRRTGRGEENAGGRRVAGDLQRPFGKFKLNYSSPERQARAMLHTRAASVVNFSPFLAICSRS